MLALTIGTDGTDAAALDAGKAAAEDTASLFLKKAPLQVTPGTTTLEGQYANDLGRVEPWKASYDEYGRLAGRTDYNAGNASQEIADTHYHTYGYNNGIIFESASHVPGEYNP